MFNLFQRIERFDVYCIFWFLMSCPLIIGCCKRRNLHHILIEGIPFKKFLVNALRMQ
jgi:hypothetical protein